jgi:FlaA1/EpsC-like NDP-sugar epimerase
MAKVKNIFENKGVLVTGGTGSIGSEIVKEVLTYNPKVVRVLTNSENELWEMKSKYEEHPKIRYLMGDIRDKSRLIRASEGIDIIFHAAAVKHVPICEYNPLEAVHINIVGTENVIEAALKNNIEKLVFISTDKAVNPVNVMGATKLLSERLCISANYSTGNRRTIFYCVRFGNILGSRGSIIPAIYKQIEKKSGVNLTDINMRRFFIPTQDAVKLVLKTVEIASGGEIFVLKMPVMKIIDVIDLVVETFCKKMNKNKDAIKVDVVGKRPGEKIHEELMTEIELESCYEIESMYIIYPSAKLTHPSSIHLRKKMGNKVDPKSIKYSTKDITPLKKEEIIKTLKNELR